MYKCPFCSSLHKSLAKLKGHFIKSHLPLSRCPACGWESRRMRKDPRKAITAHIKHVIDRPNDYEYEFWIKHVAWAYIYFRYSHTGGRIRRERLRLYKKVALDYFSLTRSCQHKHKVKYAKKHGVQEVVCPRCKTRVPIIRLRHVGLGSFAAICFNCATVLGPRGIGLGIIHYGILFSLRPHSRASTASPVSGRPKR